MADVDLEGLNYERKRPPGGLKYSAVIKNKRLKAINFLKRAFQEKQFLILLKIFLRSFRLGWCMPFLFILKKMPFWNEFVFFQLNKWGKAICKITKVKLHIITRGNVSKDKTYLFASNHLSLLDIPVLSATIPVKNKYIANRELASFFITNILIKFGESVLVDKSDRKGQIKALKDIQKSLLRGNNLIIFPESNMSYNGNLQKFQRGGLSAAVRANVSIMPVCIKGTREVCPPGAFSFKFNKDVYVIFGKEIDCKSLNREDKKNIDIIVYNKLKKLSEDKIPKNI
ncbi:MAG: lysophospholipid acyltransferase family protein [Candidatus Aminicenantaceae bacterium]